MRQYTNLVTDILDTGEIKADRTGVGTISVFGRHLRFNLKHGFPAMTTKKLAWKACVGELLWFLEGSSDERRLAEITHGSREGPVTIWTPNALAPYWKANASFDGDLGRIYGVQWRSWGPRIGPQIDQVKNLIDGLRNDPNSRRHILTAWNPGELDQMALPPCHVLCQFYVNKNKELSCHMYQRSVDVFLGLPFNIASYALFTHMLAHVCGYGVHELIISTGDTHIYLDHVEKVKEQLTRDPYAAPSLWLNSSITDIDKFTMNDIKLIGYEHHAALTAAMAV